MYDVLIVGGGMVGASLAVALQPLNLRLGLIEAYPFRVEQRQPAYDDRSVALSYGSSLIYQGMGLLDAVRSSSAAIQQIHVSDRGHWGATRLSAEQEGLPALGYVMESRVLGQILYQALQAGSLDFFAPAKALSLAYHADSIAITLTQQEQVSTLHTRLLVLADGGQSPLRDALGVTWQERDYQQHAVIANVSVSDGKSGWAYERFTPNGPLALLPMTRERYSLVWTQRADEVEAVMGWDDATFLERLQTAFGYRLGRFVQVGERSAYPLQLRHCQQVIAKRSVIIGNAAHTLHPVAGQGLNLSLRDVASLAEHIAKALQSQQDIADWTMLNAYQKERSADYQWSIPYTDQLIRWFSNDDFLLGHVRAGGLTLLDRVPPLRRLLMQQSMGLNQRHSRLGRGLALQGVAQQ